MPHDINDIDEFCLILTDEIYNEQDMKEYVSKEIKEGFIHIYIVFHGENPWGKEKIKAILTKKELAEYEMAEKLALYALFQRLQNDMNRVVEVPENIKLDHRYVEEEKNGIKVWKKIPKQTYTE